MPGWILAVLAALVVLLGWLALVTFRGAFIPVPAPGSANPAASREEALTKLAALQALDDETIASPCATRLIEAPGGSDVTIVLWHGFTNCPAQFGQVAENFASAGYNVLVPRIPRHGVADVLNRELLELSADDLVAHTNAVVDIAAGLGSQVWVVGLSAGGVLAAWAAAFRPEVRRAVLSAPFVAPKAIPMQLVRLLIPLRRLIPAAYFWWDPRKKENLGESPYVYPGFPLPGMVPFLHLSEVLFDRKLTPTNQLRRTVLTTNPGDFAIRRDVARKFAFRTFTGHSQTIAEATFSEDLGWWHDFVDPWGPHVGTAAQVSQVFFSALGVASDASAGGAIVEPVPEPDPLLNHEAA